MTPAEINAHFDLLRDNLQMSLLIGAALALASAALLNSGFTRSFLIGIAAFAAITIYLNGWPYFQVFFFSSLAALPARAALPLAVLAAGTAAGCALRWLWNRLRRSPHPTS